ncbi:hypothetical protein ACFLW9_02560 [Chloroflexota bacterium]
MVDEEAQRLPDVIHDEDWWRLNTALAHYEEQIGKEGEIVSAFAHLVCQAMISSALYVLTDRQIRDLLRDLFGGNWHMAEVSHAIRELEKAGYVERIQDPEGHKFTVKEEFRVACLREQKETEELRDGVLEQWVIEIRNKNKKLTDEDCEILAKDLVDFIVAVFDRHGVECAALLLYGEARKEEFIKIMESVDLPTLVDRGSLNVIRNGELLDFFRKAKDKRASFIGLFLRSSFLKSAIAIDPKFIGIVSQLFQGSIVVLDTNFLYALFGLSGTVENEVAKATIQFNKELGIRTIVHRISVKEFQRSLERHGKNLKSLTMPSRELVGALAQAVQLIGPIGAYYQRYANTGVAWDDWVRPFLAIEAMLEDMGIEVTDLYEEAIEKDKKLQEETDRIYEVSREHVERISGGQPLNIEVCRHDAFLRLFTDRLRKGKPNEFVKAGAWCVTLDSKLPRYEKIERRRLGDIPVFVLVEQWLQFIGPITPKTEDWGALARSLLLSPYLMVSVPGAPSTERIHRTAARIAEYKNCSLQLATRILLNARLQEGIKHLSEKEFDEKVSGVIEEALLEEYFEKEKQLELAMGERKQLAKEVGKMEEASKKQLDFQEELKGEIITIKKSSKIIYSVGMVIVMLFSGLSIDWSSLNTLTWVLAIIGMIGGGISIIGFMKDWRLALRVLVTGAAVVSLFAAILAFRTLS